MHDKAAMGLNESLARGRYNSYSYAYPHKMAYRPLAAPIPLHKAWENEAQSALFAYVHIPFCEMRCGFCNLFTMAKPKTEFESAYVSVLHRQLELTKRALPDAQYARLAIGGGTPTHLSDRDLAGLFELLNTTLGADSKRIPTSVETSPETMTPTKARILQEFGVDRVSIGIQSFLESETKAVRRPQHPEVAHASLDLLKSTKFSTVNVDLIYGIQGQTPATFEHSIRAAMAFEPEEIYLYPLYVRPLTGLGNSARAWEDARYALYLHGRDLLLEDGYEQVSMRMFRRPGTGVDGPIYCCQSDGMIGLGAGARSYTSDLHYCTDYAVGRRGVVHILEEFVARDDEQLSQVDYGLRLTPEEQRRRFVILSVLSHEGLNDADYATAFKAQPMDDFPELVELIETGLGTKDGTVLRLTQEGVGWSDAIGPWLYSESVRAACQEFELK